MFLKTARCFLGFALRILKMTVSYQSSILDVSIYFFISWKLISFKFFCLDKQLVLFTFFDLFYRAVILIKWALRKFNSGYDLKIFRLKFIFWKWEKYGLSFMSIITSYRTNVLIKICYTYTSKLSITTWSSFLRKLKGVGR